MRFLLRTLVSAYFILSASGCCCSDRSSSPIWLQVAYDFMGHPECTERDVSLEREITLSQDEGLLILGGRVRSYPVRLLDASGNPQPLLMDFRDAITCSVGGCPVEGLFLFTSLRAGEYRLEFETPAGLPGFRSMRTDASIATTTSFAIVVR